MEADAVGEAESSREQTAVLFVTPALVARPDRTWQVRTGLSWWERRIATTSDSGSMENGHYTV